jgi:hypothetical protein
MNPGIHDLTDEQYHADPCPSPSLSNSIIKVLLSKSPLHAWHAHPRLNPKYQAFDSDRFDLGTATHAMLLTDTAKLCVIDAPDWRTKAAKEQREVARANGMTVLLAHQERKAREMLDVAREFISASPLLAPAFASGDSERTMVWKFADRIYCRAKYDKFSAADNLMIDYKTSSSPNPEAFMRSSMLDFGYDTQSEFYCQGVESITGRRPRFVFLVQEDSAPYSCYIVEAGPSMQALAEHKVTRAQALWNHCLKRDEWPGYIGPHDIYTAEAPAWAIQQEEMTP